MKTMNNLAQKQLKIQRENWTRKRDVSLTISNSFLLLNSYGNFHLLYITSVDSVILQRF